MTPQQALDHCVDLVREADRDRYITALLAPRAARPALFALFAFNVELSRIAWQVREPMAGEIRLQWWRDVLAGAGQGQTGGHPVAFLMEQSWPAAFRLRPELSEMIDAHAHDLYRDPFPTLDDLRAYAAMTAGHLFALSSRCIAPDDKTPPSLWREAGCAHALTGLAAALPTLARAGRFYFPAQSMAREGFVPRALVPGEERETLHRLNTELVDAASAHLNAATQIASPACRQRADLRVTLAPLAVTKAQIARWRSHDDLWNPPQLSPLRRQWLIWRAARFGI